MPYCQSRQSLPFRVGEFKENIAVLVLVVVGVVSFRLSAWTIFSSPIGLINTNVDFVSRIMQLVAFLLIIVVDRRVSYRQAGIRVLTALAALGMCIGAVIFLFSGDEIGRYSAIALHGTCSGILLVAWGVFTCSLPPSKSVFGIMLAFAVFGSVSIPMSNAPVVMLKVLAVVAPIVSYYCLDAALSLYGGKLVSDEALRSAEFKNLPWSLIMLLFLCMLSSLITKILVPGDLALRASVPYRLLWPAIMVGVFVLYAMWARFAKTRRWSVLWPLFSLIIISGLICYSSLVTTQPVFASVFLSATQDCLMLFCWTASAVIIYEYRLPKAFSFTAMMVVFVRPPLVISSLLLMVFPSLADTQASQLAVIVTAVAAFILVILTIIVAGADAVVKSRRSEAEFARDDSYDGVARKVEALAKRYGLTQRELDVALCLAKGYTLAQTAEALFISLDTVRSHSKKLYAKLGIHKKQQLIELIENS